MEDPSAIEQAFLRAALGQTDWDTAMEAVAHEAGGCGALLFPRDSRAPSLPMTASMRPSAEIYFKDGWHTRDERDRALGIVQRRGVTSDLDVTNLDQIRKSAYYQDFLRPLDLAWFAGVGIDLVDDFWTVSIQRSPAQGPFTPDELHRLARLSGRLSSAAALARAVGFAQAEGALAAFEVGRIAVALLDRHGRVVRLNRGAEALLGEDLRIRHKRLTSFDPAATSALDRVLSDVLWSTGPHVLGQPVRLPRRLGRALVAYPLRMTGLTRDVFSPCQALITLVDPDQSNAPTTDMLRSSFGLTTREAALALALYDDLTLTQAAESLTISKETARSRLKTMFAKLGVQRQGQLIALLGRLRAPDADGRS